MVFVFCPYLLLVFSGGLRHDAAWGRYGTHRSVLSSLGFSTSGLCGSFVRLLSKTLQKLVGSEEFVGFRDLQFRAGFVYVIIFFNIHTLVHTYTTQMYIHIYIYKYVILRASP